MNKSVWGIDFFMLADRDATPTQSEQQTLTADAKKRFRTLSKYHLENYFLDAAILAKIFQSMEPKTSWLCDPAKIEDMLREIAIQHIPYATSLIVSKRLRENIGNIDIMVKGCHGKSKDELVTLLSARREQEQNRISASLSNDHLTKLTQEVHGRLEQAVKNGNNSWKDEIPGKAIFKIFCNRANIQEGRLKNLYIQEAEKSVISPFSEIVEIFRSFSGVETISGSNLDKSATELAPGQPEAIGD